MEDNTILEIKELQDELDYKTEVENKAIELIKEVKLQEAIELLATI